jgi:septum formation protein
MGDLGSPTRLVLASASPRRRELVASLGVPFEVVVSDIEETLDPVPLPEAVARLALRKARAVAASRPAAIVLAADTIVVIDGQALGKPADADEARAMLRTLRGRTHEVMTGVAVVDAATGRDAVDTDISRVTMAAFSDAAIDCYVASGEPLDKAGAYAIQGAGGVFVDEVRGSVTNVVGLPLATVVRLLEVHGIRGFADPRPAGKPSGALKTSDGEGR